MQVVFLLLLIVSALCFAGAAFGFRTGASVNLVALGLLSWVLVPLIQAIQAT